MYDHYFCKKHVPQVTFITGSQIHFCISMQTYSNMKFPVCLWFESLDLIMPVHAKAKSGSLTWPIGYE